jgi:hypothetical protein
MSTRDSRPRIQDRRADASGVRAEVANTWTQNCGSVAGSAQPPERVAILAAMNIADELFQLPPSRRIVEHRAAP